MTLRAICEHSYSAGGTGNAARFWAETQSVRVDDYREPTQSARNRSTTATMHQKLPTSSGLGLSNAVTDGFRYEPGAIAPFVVTQFDVDGIVGVSPRGAVLRPGPAPVPLRRANLSVLSLPLFHRRSPRMTEGSIRMRSAP